MAYVLVIGAGFAGCTAAERLVQLGARVLLVERGPDIGGHVKGFGCKATDSCNNCGVCLSAGLWGRVKAHPEIELACKAEVLDLMGSAGDFTALLRTPAGTRSVSGITGAVVATGFLDGDPGAHIQLEGTENVLTGSELEALLRGRDADSAIGRSVKSVAFLQCFGSRDAKERAPYCSRVCCSYAARAARVFKHADPACEATFFYMELQPFSGRESFTALRDLGVEFVKCRPLKVRGGSPAVVFYDDPARGRTAREFDLVVLSAGVRPAPDSAALAARLGLKQDENGFLRSARPGVFVAGCAHMPQKIEEAYADAFAAANALFLDAYGEAAL